MMILWQDVRGAVRTLGRSPGYAAVMVLTLTLGIGATTAVFSLVEGVLLRPLAYPRSEQLVLVDESIPELAEQYPTVPVNARHFLEWRQRCPSFANLSLLDRRNMVLTGRGEPRRLEALAVSANLFETLGVTPASGRTFSQEDETASGGVAVISAGLWQREFGVGPSSLGAVLTLDDEAYTVIGVLPSGFRFPSLDRYASSFLVFGSQPEVFTLRRFTDAEKNELMGNFRFGVIGRLRSGVTCAQATAELDVIQAQLMNMAGLTIGLRAAVEPLKEVLVHNSRGGLWLLLGAIGTLLLIACLNLGILSLTRAEGRDTESAVRAALGATRAQLLRQALVEVVLLALLGSVAGLAVAGWGLDVLVRLAPADVPRLNEVHLDGSVLVFALGLTAVTALVFGTLPACRVAGARAEQALRVGRRTATAGTGRLHLRGGLVAAEVGLGVALLITAGLLLGSFTRVIHADPGFQVPAVLAAEITLGPTRYEEHTAAQFYERLLAELATTVGVESAAVISALPLEGEAWVDAVGVPGDPRPAWECPRANIRFASSGYFRTMGIPLLAGRTFEHTDRARRVAVISQRLARSLWPGQETVTGHKVLVNGQEWEVVGVVSDVRARADRGAVAMLYRPYWALETESTTLVVHARSDPLSIAGAIRTAVRKTDAAALVTAVRTMREVLEVSVSQRRFQMLLTSVFASCALLLAGFGIYGVVSHAVTQRTREMGIRVAFGARAPDLCFLVLRQGMTPVVLGVVCGVAGALVGGRFLRSLLYEVKPHDPGIIAAVVGTVLLLATLACYLPARRAARIDPMVALRYE
ncbi:MAG: ABC transporter permease [Planctomycetes bacterium]|nr:ABC transporter permease [Planctomycetota bacterium]